MKQTIGLSEFRSAFYSMGRGDQFSYEGLEALFNYLDELYIDMGEDYDLDVVALCCEFTEYEDFDEVFSDYGMSEDELRDNTTVLNVGESGFIVAAF